MASNIHRLTRRDALAVLTAIGVVTGGSVAAYRWGSGRSTRGRAVDLADREVATLNAIAAVLYPSNVTGIPSFVETYTVGRIRNRPNYAKNVKDALETIDRYAQDWYYSPYRSLSSTSKDSLLRQIGIETSEPIPGGNDAERLRYYLVNELLFAFYTSPTGGELIGLENPQGYPGGLDSYQRGPSP